MSASNRAAPRTHHRVATIREDTHGTGLWGAVANADAEGVFTRLGGGRWWRRRRWWVGAFAQHGGKHVRVCDVAYQESARAYAQAVTGLPPRYRSQDRVLQLTNPHPGTVLDGGLTNPSGCEFLMVTQHIQFNTREGAVAVAVVAQHIGLKMGTAAFSMYTCLHNDKDPGVWTLDLIERTTYQLCYLYWNWFGVGTRDSVCVSVFPAAAILPFREVGSLAE
eukprot:gene1379-4415_t